jgi:hypothetical protein
MNAFDVGCRWFGACAALVMLSACHGSPAQSGTLPNVVSSAELGKSVSWMALEAASEDLLYLSDVVANDVKVYSFREGRLVGTLTGFGKPRSECADEAGNVWIADIEGRDVIEYPHGGTKPIASLDTFGVPLGCSVDSAGHYLAVAGGISGAIVSIYHEGSHGRWSDPKRYTDSAMRIPYFCGYDSNGNLFIDGLTKSKAGRFTLVELRRRSKSFESIAVSQAIDTPGQVQWDGKDLAIGDSGVAPSVAYRFSISGSNATEVGMTTFDGTISVRQFWIAGGTLVGPDFNRNAGFWRYPAGGAPIKTIARVHSYGAAVSRF